MSISSMVIGYVGNVRRGWGDNKMKCCICNEEIVGRGNNARPLKRGVCCDKCNVKVIEERIKRLKRRMKNENVEC